MGLWLGGRKDQRYLILQWGQQHATFQCNIVFFKDWNCWMVHTHEQLLLTTYTKCAQRWAVHPGVMWAGMCCFVKQWILRIIEGSLHVPATEGRVPFAARIPELLESHTPWPCMCVCLLVCTVVQAREQGGDRELVVFTCQYSAHRAPQCANWYRAVR
eukprot:403387-Amphidinium_carterae.1